ncbi:ArsR family transcriptional regulator [Ktedonosporobacter rubrisoli]|uniref:ArsR family transcriptional regulator n=1 Tax=Ktedonosporobacter rubrisoli TaxID=2509675 RepID=A0A4P6JP38_KTERU|nr:metalloregulator ArsR/SmtB family transcription factor [Ktedonosporobacter rubrisoli]QBD76890.1 ArsR family transcriptional regulator [Ktedonosporobacter rubrisoli]
MGRKPKSIAHLTSDIADEVYLAEILATLGQPSRLRILQTLAAGWPQIPLGTCERRPEEFSLLLGLAPATISEHLQRLVACHLIDSRRQGTTRWYRLIPSPLLLALFELRARIGETYAAQECKGVAALPSKRSGEESADEKTCSREEGQSTTSDLERKNISCLN